MGETYERQFELIINLANSRGLCLTLLKKLLPNMKSSIYVKYFYFCEKYSNDKILIENMLIIL